MSQTPLASVPASDVRIAIIGAGECGTHAAIALRQKGFTGSITLIGAEGIHAYERPPLSKALTGEEPLVHPWSIEQLEDADVDLRIGVTAERIDAATKVVVTDAGEIPYDRLLLALGSSARALPAAPGAISLRTHEDAAALRERLRPEGHLLVIGAGLIGLEVAAQARTLGMDVTVVEAAEHPLTRVLPPDVAAEVLALHHGHGVVIRTGVTVTELTTPDGGRQTATLSDGTTLVVDAVLAAVGAEPGTALAAAAGLTVDDGIVVDERLRTSDPSIWAAGDCANYPDPRSGRRVRIESWRSAHDMAEAVADSLLDESRPHAAVPWLWSEQYDSMLQVSGIVEDATRFVRRELRGGATLHLGLDAEGRVAYGAALGPGPVVAKEIRVTELLIGAGIAPQTSQLIDPAVRLRSLL